MALIKCPKCGKENVSDSTEACPECGHRIKKYFDEENKNVDEKNKEDKSVSAANNNNSGLGYGLIIFVILLAFLIIGFVSCVNKNDDNKTKRTWELECDWCGKEEECSLYCVQSLDGFNKDGSIKYKYDYLNFSESCYKKAKNDGAKYGWTNIVPVD